MGLMVDNCPYIKEELVLQAEHAFAVHGLSHTAHSSTQPSPSVSLDYVLRAR